MTLREVYAPSLKRTVKLGRRPEVAPGPHFRLARYLGAALPDPPDSCDYSLAGASTSAALADIEGNDSLGDCVIAWLLHQLAVWTGNATGTAYHASRDEAISLYSRIAGYVPGDPSTDRGTDMTVAMNWIVANGYPNGDRPVGWVRIDATNVKELQQAIWLFEGCGFAIGLPDAIVASMPTGNGFVWDVSGAPNPQNGHAFLGYGYNATAVGIDTWGLLGGFTYAAVAAYASANNGGEIDVLLSSDMIAAAALKAPNGFDWRTLVADFDAMGGTVPVPPSPAPPSPPLSGPMTLAMAQALITNGMAVSAPLLTRAQAIRDANAALAAGWSSSAASRVGP